MHPVTEEAPTEPTRLLATAHPRFLLSFADGHPPALRLLLQLGLLIAYPAWLFLLLMYLPFWVIGKIVVGILWVLLWPVRAAHKKNNPEEYAAFVAEQEAEKQGARAQRSR